MKFPVLRATAAAALALVVSSSYAGALFSVNERVIDPSPGSNPGGQVVTLGDGNLVDLTGMNGAYTERLILTSATTFSTVAIFDISAWLGLPASSTGVALGGNETVTIPGFGTFKTDAYKMYGIFKASGNINNTNGTLSFSGSTASFELIADRNSDTTKTFTGTNPSTYLDFSIGNDSDDAVLARSNKLLGGDGMFTPANQALGNFAILFEELDGSNPLNPNNGLTALGKSFFYKPDPFYAVVRTSGNFAGFTIDQATNGVQFAGAMEMGFEVPEPGSLALAGLALLGLGAVTRRKKQG